MNRKPVFRRHLAATLSILLTFVFISLAVCGPATMDARAETDWNEAVGAGAITGAAGALIGGAAFDGPGALIGGAAGFLGGLIGNLFGQAQQDAAFLDAKEAYAQELTNITNNYIGLAHTANLNTINNYEAMQYFFARKAEYAALQLYQYQEENNLAHTYDPWYVLSESQVANGTMAAEWMVASQYEAILNQYSDLATTFVGTYDGMDWGYSSPDGVSGYPSSHVIRASDIADKTYRLVVIGMKAATGNYYYTLAANTTYYLINIENISPIYSGDPANINNVLVKLTARDGTEGYNQTLNFTKGEGYDFTVERSGDYKFTSSSSAIILVGPFARAISGSATPTTMICSGYKDGDSITFDIFNINKIWFDSESDAAKSCSLTQINTDLAAIAAKVATMQTNANNYAQAYYNSIVSSGGSGNRVFPDVVFPDPADLQNMTAEQVYAIYLAYLREMQSWFANYSVMNPADVNISEESLHLLCRGAIVAANGTELYDNTTIFTPYVSLDTINLVIGNNTITTPTFAIKWGNADTLAEYTNITDVTYIDLPLNSTLRIEEMTVDGEDVTEVTLTPTTIQYIVYEEFNDFTPPQGATDWAWIMAHWYYLALAFGVVILLGGFMTRSWMILIVGGVVIIIGLGGWFLSSGGFHIPGLF